MCVIVVPYMTLSHVVHLLKPNNGDKDGIKFQRELHYHFKINLDHNVRPTAKVETVI